MMLTIRFCDMLVLNKETRCKGAPKVVPNLFPTNLQSSCKALTCSFEFILFKVSLSGFTRSVMEMHSRTINVTPGMFALFKWHGIIVLY